MEIAPGIYDLTPPRFGYFKAGYTHAFIVQHEGELLLVDTLFDTHPQLFLDEIARMGKTPKDIKHILLTHAHRGHCGGLAALKKLSGALVYSHVWEADIIAGERHFQTPDIFVFSPLITWPIVTVGTLLRSRHVPCPVDRLIDDGDKIGPLLAVHTPGHTPGHIAFYWPERRILFSGDAYENWPAPCPGWRNATLNVPQSWASLRRLAALDVDLVGSGHGKPIVHDGGAVLRALATRGKV